MSWCTLNTAFGCLPLSWTQSQIVDEMLSSFAKELLPLHIPVFHWDWLHLVFMLAASDTLYNKDFSSVFVFWLSHFTWSLFAEVLYYCDSFRRPYWRQITHFHYNTEVNITGRLQYTSVCGSGWCWYSRGMHIEFQRRTGGSTAAIGSVLRLLC